MLDALRRRMRARPHLRRGVLPLSDPRPTRRARALGVAAGSSSALLFGALLATLITSLGRRGELDLGEAIGAFALLVASPLILLLFGMSIAVVVDALRAAGGRAAGALGMFFAFVGSLLAYALLDDFAAEGLAAFGGAFTLAGLHLGAWWTFRRAASAPATEPDGTAS